MAVYARLRPPRPGSGDPPCEVLPAADDRSGSRKKSVPTDLEFTVQRKASAGHVNNLPQRFCFHFDGVRVCAAPLVSHAVQHTSPPRRALFARQVFDQFTRQDTVFKVAARDIVRGALKGFNGTIFAYGQTGSGKTYTITGGAQYKERGFIPRTISTVFSGIKKAPEGTSYKVKLSYIEIYNENIYDLLDRYVPGAGNPSTMDHLTALSPPASMRRYPWKTGRRCTCLTARVAACTCRTSRCTTWERRRRR